MNIQSSFRLPLNIGFLSPHNPYDRRNFSGTPYFALRALQAEPDLSVRVLGSYSPPRLLDRFTKRRQSPPEVSALNLEGLDVVVGLVGSELLEKLQRAHPRVRTLHVTDATPAFLRDAYGWQVPAAADITERNVAAHAARVVYSSPEMAARAGQDLGLPTLQPAVAHFGINLPDIPNQCPQKPPLQQLNLLFVGLDWERKGGDIAVAALDQLRAVGQPAHLTIVGRCPERHRGHPHITYAGFLNKNRDRDLTKLSALYTQAHLLLLPSRADCTPMVMAEAMVHGTPVVAADTGGVGSLLGGPGAGQLMPPYASPEEWAAMIVELTRNKDVYDMLSDASFERGQKALSWQAWARKIIGTARDVCSDADQQRSLKVAV